MSIFYPTKVLNLFDKLINNTKVEDKDIELLKERDFNLSQQIKKTQKKVQELKRNVTMMSQVIREIETDLLESLSRLRSNNGKTMKPVNCEL